MESTKASKKHLVVVTSRFPYPLEKGDKLRIFNQIISLSKEFDVTLVALNEEPILDDHIDLVEDIVKELYIVKVGGIYRALSLLVGLFLGRPFQLSYFYSAKAKKDLSAIIKHEKPDLVYAHLLRSAQYVLDIDVPVITDYMDAFSLIMRRRAKKSSLLKKMFYQLESRLMKKYELAVASKFAMRTMISAQDIEYITNTIDEDFKVIPNGVDLEYFAPATGGVATYDIVFVGNMGYEPNVRAAHFLVEEILPLLITDFPDLKILIAGARPVRSVKFLASEHVAVSGWIDDIRDAYASGRVMMAPIFSGAGQQNKILEAMSMGIPCVTSALVNNAIGAVPKEQIEIAQTPQEFAEATKKLLNEKKYRQMMSHNARTFVCETYSWTKSNNILIENMKNIIS